MVRSDGRERTMLYVGKGVERMDTILPNGDVTEIMISWSDKGYMRWLDPLNKTYKQVKLPKNLNRRFNPDALYDWIEDGFETVDNRKCRRFVGRLKRLKGVANKSYELCLIDAKTGMQRRRVGYGENGKAGVAMDYLNSKIGPPPRKLFEMPEGYKRGYWR